MIATNEGSKFYCPSEKLFKKFRNFVEILKLKKMALA